MPQFSIYASNKQKTNPYLTHSVYLGRSPYMKLRAIVAFMLLALAHGTLRVVSIQSQSQEQMNALTDAIDVDSQTGPHRVTLGTIEATQSRVVDVESAYLSTDVQYVPTLSMLGSIEYLTPDSHGVPEPEWHLTYSTSKLDGSNQLNHYGRVLYFTNGQQTAHGDIANPCLTAGVAFADCVADLQTHYTLLGAGAPSEGTDWLSYTDNQQDVDAGCTTCKITSVVTDHDNSATQTLQLVIPHSVIKTMLGHNRLVDSPTYGFRTHLTFGVGMLFLPIASQNAEGATPPTNVILFDQFTIIEDDLGQAYASQTNAYAVASHVAFWTAAAQLDSTLRIVTVEYLLDDGQEWLDASISLNGPAGMRSVSVQDCDDMQSKIAALQAAGHETACLTKHTLCQPSIYTSSDGDAWSWITIVWPLPEWHVAETFNINTMIKTNATTLNDGRGMEVLSSVNFVSSHSPRISCQAEQALAFDATQHVVAELYRGVNLAYEPLQGTFQVNNETAMSMVESLMTVILRPDDQSADAIQYFATYTDEILSIDDVYISHALAAEVLPDSISNHITGAGGGRSQIQLDPTLSVQCPYEPAVPTENNVGECLTTHDWNLQGSMNRNTELSYNTFFVHQVSAGRVSGGEALDRDWLIANIFGTSNAELVERFRQSVVSKLSAAGSQYAVVYWIWPVYHWPNKSPIGLVDKAIVSLSWSLAPEDAHTRRRLLSRRPEKQFSIRQMHTTVPYKIALQINTTHTHKGSHVPHKPSNQTSQSHKRVHEQLKFLLTNNTHNSVKRLKRKK